MEMEKKFWKKGMLLVLALVLVLAFAACQKGETASSEDPAQSLLSQEDRTKTFPQGVTVGGQSLAGKTFNEGLDLCRASISDAVSKLSITVAFGEKSVTLSGSDFTAKDVMDRLLAGALSSGEAQSLELSYVTDLSESGRQKLNEAAKGAIVQGKNASVAGFDGDGFVFTEEKKGSRVDMTATLASIEALLAAKKSGSVQASMIDVTPETTKETLSKKFRLIASYSTDSTNTANGNSNMALAMSHCNGTILQPGEVFSYNDTIGDSTDPANGWLPAGGLSGGLLVQVYGGGICQGSTTIYGAALRAGMEIVWRDCHSTPSSYCPIGLDATVDYGNIDFRFRNPLDAPVYLSCGMDGVTVWCRIYGCVPDEWDEIEVGSEQTGSTPIPEQVRFVTDEKLTSGQYVRKSSGQWGYTARAWRTFYKNGEVVRTEELPSSEYSVTPVTYAVGPDTDTSKVDTTEESGTIDAAASPSPSPSPSPSAEPTEAPTPEPTEEPSDEPSEGPSEEPWVEPSEEPWEEPSEEPWEEPVWDDPWMEGDDGIIG